MLRRSLPLATRPAPLAQLDLGNWQGYIKSSLVPHVVGAGVALILSLILLLSFLAWRLVKLCSCCECVRGPQREGKKARKLLTGSGARWVKAAVLLLAAGVLAGGIYGETQVQAVMVDAGLAAITTVTDYIEAALAAGAATVAATQAMDAQLLVVKDGLTGLGPMAAGLVAPYTQASPRRRALAGRGPACRYAAQVLPSSPRRPLACSTGGPSSHRPTCPRPPNHEAGSCRAGHRRHPFLAFLLHLL